MKDQLNQGIVLEPISKDPIQKDIKIFPKRGLNIFHPDSFFIEESEVISSEYEDISSEDESKSENDVDTINEEMNITH